MSDVPLLAFALPILHPCWEISVMGSTEVMPALVPACIRVNYQYDHIREQV